MHATPVESNPPHETEFLCLITDHQKPRFVSNLIVYRRELQRNNDRGFAQIDHVMMMQKFVTGFCRETRLVDARLLRLFSSRYWTNRTRTVPPITLQLNCTRRIGGNTRRKCGRSSRRVGLTVDVDGYICCVDINGCILCWSVI